MSEENQVAAKPVLTKEEKLAKIQKQIAALNAKYDDILNDRQPQAKAKKEAFLPTVGQQVVATVGRNTATSQASTKVGTVIAVKLPEVGEDGKAKGGVLVRVRINEGTFDEQVVTLFAKQTVPAEAERPLGQLPE